jgi:error-prone DNA polymerase
VTLGEHPIEILRHQLGRETVRSAELGQAADGSRVEVAGLVVARQRPATARGVVFMLLEDELGAVNVVVPPPVYASHRLAVRTASFAFVIGRLERREGVVNVVASSVEPIAAPSPAAAQVRRIEPPADRETGRETTREAPAEELEAVAPRAHSFGRRG